MIDRPTDRWMDYYLKAAPREYNLRWRQEEPPKLKFPEGPLSALRTQKECWAPLLGKRDSGANILRHLCLVTVLYLW